jgi:thioredoxin 1
MSQVHEVNDGNFEAEVLQSELPVLVDFSATWCAPCKKLDPIVHEIAGEYDGKVKVVHVDIDNARTTAAGYGILSVPTLLFVKAGEVMEKVTGLLAKSALEEKLRKVL